MISIEQLQIIHEAASEIDAGDQRWIDAANLALAADGIQERVNSAHEGRAVLQTLEKNLASEGNFMHVAVLLWGNGMFDSRPECVRSVFRKVRENSRLIIIGASSQSKTFSAGVYYYLEWRRDPYWTAVKLAAPSEDHLYTNLFSHLVALHRASVIPMTDDDSARVKVNETDLFISMTDALPEMRIQGVLCKQSQVSAGAMRGHKPKPYRKPHHPKWGNSTRLFILIDECTQVSPGAFEDIKTTEASIDEGMDNVKIVMCCNPEGVSYKIVQMAEPEDGWDAGQVGSLFEWTSKLGYPVLRLDAAKSENVTERRVVFPRLMTYEAYQGFLRAGEHSASYWAKARGFPPLMDSAYNIVQPPWMQSQRGEPIYVGRVRSIAVLDTALGGADKALLGVGRWGDASGWRKPDGTIEWFTSRADPEMRINKHVAVLDQIFDVPKTNSTVEVIQHVMGLCKRLGIQPEDVAMDQTGNAAGVYSHAKKYWGNVLGVNFGEGASSEPVLAEDQLMASDIYDGKVTELWFAMARWLDPVVCALLINPIVPQHPLFSQVTTRRYRNVKGGRVRVEPKEEYRVRNSAPSPDEADLLCMLVEWCRRRGGWTPGISERETGDSGDDFTPVAIENAEDGDGSISSAEWTPNRLDSE